MAQTPTRMPLRPSEKLITSIISEDGGRNSSLPEPLPEQFIKINHLTNILRDMDFDIPFASPISDDVFILTEVSRIITELEKSGIKSVVIKSLPAVPKPIGDVDILVDDLKKAGELLEQNKYDVSIDPDPHKLLCLSTIDGVLVNIHLHGEIAWRRVIYLNPLEVIHSATERVFHKITFPVASLSLKFLSQLHICYTNGEI